MDFYDGILANYGYVLEKKHAIDEGIAVLYSIINNQIREDNYENGTSEKALIIDCGGGTSDLASCEFTIDKDEDGIINLDINTEYMNGDVNFGGNNLTYRIMQYIYFFARAVLEKAYLFLDDDMKMEALTQTNMLKTIITNEGPMLIEKKRVQSYPASIFSKLMGFGNGTLNAANDKSDAFFRRQIIISTKPKPVDRVDDPFLVEKFIDGKEGIFLWMFNGLQRLYANDFKFTISQRTADNLQKSIEDSCNIIGFMQDEQLVKFGADLECSTADLYSGYCYWCGLNSVTAMKKESFNLWVKQNHHRYNITYSDYVISHSNGKKARGYRGIDTTYRSIVK